MDNENKSTAHGKHIGLASYNTRSLVMGALCLGLSFILSLIKIYELPSGGSITPASMLPIIFYCYVFGYWRGLLVCVLYGLMQMMQGIFFMNVVQFFLDYILAFTALALAGILNKNIYLAILVACLGRLVISFFAGLYWIPEGANPVIWSITYNAAYILPECALCLVITAVPAVRKLFDTQKVRNKREKG